MEMCYMGRKMEFCIEFIPEMFYHTSQKHLIIRNKIFNEVF